jgi:hypothetical protein
MMRHILSVVPKDDYVLQLTFDGNEERLFDLKPYLKGALFVPLKDEELFRKVKVSKKPRGLVWPNGADLCSDMLYMNSLPYEMSTNAKPWVSRISRAHDPA